MITRSLPVGKNFLDLSPPNGIFEIFYNYQNMLLKKSATTSSNRCENCACDGRKVNSLWKL